MGYLNMDQNKRYSLNMKILSLGFSFFNNSSLIKLVQPYVDKLSSELNKTVNLVVLDNLEIVYLYRREVKRFLNYDLHAGSRLPAYCTAAGKILLAGLTDEKLKKWISSVDLKPITSKTITSKDLLWKEIMKTRKRGYGICDKELSMDLYSLAVPLVREQGEIIAAINVTMDAKDTENRIKKEIVSRLIEMGQQISQMLGYKGPYPKLWL